MDFKPQTRFLFSYESTNMKISNVVVREIKILDQFGKSFQKSIKDFNTPKAICGYVVSALGPYVAKTISFIVKMSEVEVLIKKLNDPGVVVPEVEKSMEIIQAQRKLYVKDFAHEFRTKREKDKYITDWVAKYEIGEVVKTKASQLENVIFLRYVSFQFPDLVKDVKHEERKRLKEEERFVKERFIVESYFGGRRHQTLEEWIFEGSSKIFNTYDKPLVVVGDMMGHYVTFLACKVVREDGNLEDTVFLFNSLKDNHISYQEIIFTICQLAFPEGIFGK